MQIQIKRPFRIEYMEAEFSPPLDSDSLLKNLKQVTWTFSGTLGRTRTESKIIHDETQGITRKLLEEIYTQTHLKEVYRLTIKSILIQLRFMTSTHKKHQDHTIIIRGHGCHSKVSFDPSDFVYEIFSDQTMCDLIDDLIESLVEDIQ